MTLADVGAVFAAIVFLYFAGMQFLYGILHPVVQAAFGWFGVSCSPLGTSLATAAVVIFALVALLAFVWRRAVPTFT